jgi:penicillin-insensitive murein endopeptidase
VQPRRLRLRIELESSLSSNGDPHPGNYRFISEPDRLFWLRLRQAVGSRIFGDDPPAADAGRRLIDAPPRLILIGVSRNFAPPAAALALMLTGCVGPNFFSDGTSISVGSFNQGILRRGARLPVKGKGYVIPELWVARRSNYATDELVRAIARAARRVAGEYPGALLGVGDLSLRGGADSLLHHSHRNGRDADLIYYAIDERGRPVTPANSMPRYSADRHAHAPLPPEHGVVYGPFSPRLFDVARNWALVRALLEETSIEVQYLFIHERLKQLLLTFARRRGESPELIERADALLRQPSDSAPHDDHLHVRIYCAPADRALGCVDRGPLRWWKKRYKYMPPSEESPDRLTPKNVVARGRASVSRLR